MKRTAVALSAALLSAALAATAAQPEASNAAGDYAYRWPLKTEGQNAAWQFELTPEVYAALIDPDLGDFVVLNADGQAVPVARLTVDPATRPGVAQAPLPVFALPRRASDAGADDLSLRLERDGNGRLRLLQVDMGASAASTTTASPVSAPAMPAPIDYVMDADLGRDPKRPATVDRLDLRWPDIGDVHARFAMEGSDDLEHWQTLVDGAAVVSLRRGGSVLQRRDIALPPTSLRYLRLRQLDGDPVPGLQVTARRTRGGAQPPQWRRVRAEFVDTAPDAFGKGHLYRYRLPAKLPVGRVGVILGADNATAEVILDAQNGSAGGEDAWTPIGRTLLFRLQQNGLRIDNEDYALTAPIAAREWRLRSPIALTPAPTMDVAYLPDRFVFLAQGSGPYTLAAGSRDARRDPLPVEQALAPLRSRLGAEWSPPVAMLGARSEAAGTQAYAEKATPPDWRRWLLWGFLVLGAAIVGGFALSLLRQPKPPG